MSRSRHAIRSSELERDLFSEQAIKEWAEGLIKSWLVRMDQLGIMDTKNSGTLARSLTYHILWESRDGDQSGVQYLHRVVFAFHVVGKFVDYGLGRGTDIKDRFERGSDPNQNPRKRKEWMRRPWLEAMDAIYPLIKVHATRFAKSMLRSGFEGTAETHFKTRDI